MAAANDATTRRHNRSSDNSRILSGSADKCLILWDVASGQVIRKIYGHPSRINCVRLNTDCTVAYSGS